MNAKPLLSVVVCTYDRPEPLSRCLSSLVQARDAVRQTTIELLVVDNGPAALARVVIAALPPTARITLISHSPPGLSGARNRGAEAATGQFLAYVDDDAMVPVDYLRQVVALLIRHQPDMLGGPISPYYTTPPPAWFSDAFEIRRHADHSGWSTTCAVSGSNFVIARPVLISLGGFDQQLGMTGHRQAFGEDRELVERYRARFSPARQRVYYALECVVLHWVPPSKMRVRYMLVRRFRGGMMHADLGIPLLRGAGPAEAVPLPTAVRRYVTTVHRAHGWSMAAAVRVGMAVAFQMGRLVGRCRRRVLGAHRNRGLVRSRPTP